MMSRQAIHCAKKLSVMYYRNKLTAKRYYKVSREQQNWVFENYSFLNLVQGWEFKTNAIQIQKHCKNVPLIQQKS